tara:strand:+ start:551 stop:802 length:252 start_codon:yes stop_codon:yes gene_type:complete
MTTPYLMDGSGNISIIYALTEDGSYNQLYGKSEKTYKHMVDNNKIPFIGYELDNKLIFYDANEQKIIFREDSINNDIDKEKLS